MSITTRFFLLTLAAVILAATCGVPETHAQSFQLRVAFPKLRFTDPVDFQHARDYSNRVFVVEKPGIIKVFDNSPSTDSARVFLDISSRVFSEGELGLLGLAFHPNFFRNGFFYVYYVASNPLRTVVARYHVDDANSDVADTASEMILLTVERTATFHVAGQLAFGPDGDLYIASGDGAQKYNAANSHYLLGKILRVDVDNPPLGKRYAIPKDNPYAGDTTGIYPEIYAVGFRNPWRFSFDPVTGWLWAGDVGETAWEEVNIVARGGNYGWAVMEGAECFPPGTATCDQTGLSLPVWSYSHQQTGGVAIVGGVVYRGSRFPELFGEYIYGDFGLGRIWGLRYDSVRPAINRVLVQGGSTISAFGTDANNELYVCGLDGRIYTIDEKVDAIPPPPPASRLLRGNRPNPFAATTTIHYVLPSPSHVRVVVRDILGRIVATLADNDEIAGTHAVVFDGAGLAPGIYYYSVTDGHGRVEQQRMVLQR